MARITWQALNLGDVTDISTPANPGLTRLEYAGRRFQIFLSSVSPTPAPVTPLVVTISGRTNYAIYVQVRTNRGPRQFKFSPRADQTPRFRFGYRYLVGLGAEVRDGELHQMTWDLEALANSVEPATSITSVDAVFVRAKDVLDIEVIDPAAPDPVADITPVEAARFLTQATFGATSDSIAALVSTGSYEAWIDDQFAAPVSLTMPYVTANSNGSLNTTRHEVWFDNALNGADQLRQRMAFAWSQLFVISDRDYVLSNSQYSVSQFYDLLAEQGLGNFRQLLETVTLHPAMGVFLSMLGNERADPSRNVRPDENFAREVLQLFTIGLYELDDDGRVRTRDGEPIATYDQSTIEEFARVFTGWTFDGQRSWNETNAGFQNREAPMVPYEEYHDSAEKRLLNGVVLPAGQSAPADMTAALDNIFAHPNVGPFVSTHLIQRLVTSNPTSGYVGRVAAVFNDDGVGERGNLAAVVKAILLDPEARTGHLTDPTTFGKLREPVIRVTQLFRAFSAQPGPTADGVYVPEGRPMSRIDEVVGQAVMRSRSVFNFYRPDHAVEPLSDLVSPELQILSEINVASTNNMFFSQIYGYHNRSDQYGVISRVQVEREVEMSADPEALIDHLDLLLTAGSLPAAVRAELVEHVESIPDTDEGRFSRALDAMYLVVGSPFQMVQK